MRNLLVLIIVLNAFQIYAQTLSITDKKDIKVVEDTLKSFGNIMLNGATEEERFFGSYKMVVGLKTALKFNYSYQYQFDSLLPIQILYSPDNKFRIFTWHVLNDNQQYRYFGAIQLNTDTLTLYPLIDYSDFIDEPENKLVDNQNWYGAVYYQIFPVTIKKKTYYTLLGSDGHNFGSNRKVMEILHFTKEGKPRFGYPMISYDKKLQNRFIFEFSNDVWASMRYIPEEKKIIYDHVLPLDKNAEGFFSQYLPDGTYEGFAWQKNKWVHIDMIDYIKREDGDVPNVQPKGSTDYKNPNKK